jgi:PIN domain nuclease of toxin-antitoxin system
LGKSIPYRRFTEIPFDRALIGQAAVEGLCLVATDGEIPLYASSRVNIIH